MVPTLSLKGRVEFTCPSVDQTHSSPAVENEVVDSQEIGVFHCKEEFHVNSRSWTG